MCWPPSPADCRAVSGAALRVSAASAIRWRALDRTQGNARPKALGGDRRIEAQAGFILGLVEATPPLSTPPSSAWRGPWPAPPDITLAEIRSELAAEGIGVSASRRSGAFATGARSRSKKTAHATEQDRPDVLKQRQAWFDGQPDLDPSRLVCIDETWTSTVVARKNGRAPRGQRLRVGVPHGHWKTTTFVAGLWIGGIIAPFVIDGPINKLAFEAYVEKVLSPSCGTATSS